MINVTRQPYDPGLSGWNSVLPKHQGFGSLSGHTSADIVIIGAGFAGLSAARRIKQIDANARVIVLEARKIAEGPAGRNSGFMIDLPHNLASKNYAGDTSSDQKQIDVNRAAITFAQDSTDEYSMPEEALRQSGKINAAATDKGHRHNVEYARHLNNIGESSTLLNETEMREICGTSYYLGGLYTPGTALLQPALYIRCFANGVAKSGVSVFENSAVRALEKTGNGWVVSTQKGKVSCDSVVLATNGHVESFGFYKRRLMHIYLYASMTAPLDDEQVRQLGGEQRWAFTPADPMGTTVRKINELGGTRIVVRNRFTWSPERHVTDAKLVSIAKRHDRSFNARFPQLSGCLMEHRWGGLLCLSQNSTPAFGELDKGLYSACCQNGLGTAVGTASGMAIGEMQMGVSSKLTEFFKLGGSPNRLPPEPIASIGANAVMYWRELKAGREL